MTTETETKDNSKTLKEKLIEEAQKLIGIAEIDRSFLYFFVKRDEKLAFTSSLNRKDTDIKILQIPGAKILRGLEECHWDVYGDAFVYHFTPNPPETKKEVVPQENDKSHDYEKINYYIEKAKQLFSETRILSKSNYHFIARDGILQFVKDVDTRNTDNLLFCAIGKIACDGYSDAQWLDIGNIINNHFSKRIS